MKKYPVIYQGKEYEVRWEDETYCGVVFDYIIAVYEVIPYTSFFTHKKKLKYKKIDSYYSSVLNKFYDLNQDDEDLYIKQAKCVVSIIFEEIEKKEKKRSFKRISKTET